MTNVIGPRMSVGSTIVVPEDRIMLEQECSRRLRFAKKTRLLAGVVTRERDQKNPRAKNMNPFFKVEHYVEFPSNKITMLSLSM